MENPQKPDSPLTGWPLALDRAPLFLSVLLLFSMPFITQVEGTDPLYPKWALTQILVSLMLCAWILKILLTGRFVWVQTKAHLFLGALIAWILISIISSRYSVIGWMALNHWVCFPIWYLLLTLTIVEAWKAENLIIVFLAAGLGTSGWAIGQALGLGGGDWLQVVKNQFGGRVTAGMGNPEFLSGYLLLVWPLALALFVRSRHLVTRVIWSGVMFLSLFAILWTGSKAGWLGLVLGALVFAFCFFGRGAVGKSILKIIAIAALTVLLSFFFPPMSNRLESLADPQNESVWFRTTVWKGVVEMIKAHPLTGTGFGTFETAYPSYRPASLMMRQTQRSYAVDHAHNWILEWTAETGIIGLGLLLAFWWYVLAQWWKLFSANAIPRALGAGVFAAFSGAAVDNLFDVNSYLPSTLVPLLMLAALPVALSQRFYRIKGFLIQYKDTDLSRYKIYLLPLALLAAGPAFLQVKGAFQGQLADMELKKAALASQSGKWDEAIGFYDTTLSMEPGNITARYFRGSVYFDRGKEGDMVKALADLESVGRVAPDYVLLHFKKYEVLSHLNRLEEAKSELKRAVSLDPMLIFLLDDFKKARDLTSEGKFSMAFVLYQNLYLDYPTCVPMVIDYANCFALTHDYASAINLYRHALELDPGNEKALNDLRKVYEAQKKVEDSRKNVFGHELN